MKKNLLISACLLSISCRYDGKDNALSEKILDILSKHFILIPACPEQLGGLSTPRLSAEIQHNGKVFKQDGVDVSCEFIRGANEALKIAKISQCRIALLKANSPSCGNEMIYDGSFSGKLIPGQGQTVKIFENHAIKVYNENEIKILIKENCDV
ncbi:MAG: DUF523 domain-containing protein [Candidatus Marinimicrobia bacterium]|nr:DUF523 domain-containing protein [Candidatus Neomarinimicrobiota bacterium]